MQVFLSEFVRAPRDRQLAAWIAALTASLAALFIAEIMGQSPCSLCSFQRAPVGRPRAQRGRSIAQKLVAGICTALPQLNYAEWLDI